jgi:ureidoacrylate peracid hydrolase
LKVEETAILLIEFQKEFCYEDGALYGMVKEEMARIGTINNTVDLVKRAREKGVTIIHIPITFSKDYREIPEPTGVLANVKEAKAFKKGTKGAEIIDELKPEPEDIVIEGKRTVSAFPSTNLDFILRSLGIKNVAVAGFLTNVCVESTVRSAYDRGYRVTLLKNCVASPSKEAQEATEAVMPTFGQVMNHEEFLGKLE